MEKKKWKIIVCIQTRPRGHEDSTSPNLVHTREHTRCRRSDDGGIWEESGWPKTGVLRGKVTFKPPNGKERWGTTRQWLFPHTPNQPSCLRDSERKESSTVAEIQTPHFSFYVHIYLQRQLGFSDRDPLFGSGVRVALRFFQHFFSFTQT